MSDSDSDSGIEATPKTPAYSIPKEDGVAPVAPTMPVDVMIDKYRRLRTKKEEIVAEQKKVVAQYNAALEYLEGMLLSVMNAQGVDKITARSDSEHFGGTAYKTVETRCNVTSWHTTLDFIKAHDAYELLEARVSKTVVLDYLQNTGELIPGVSLVQRVNVNVRKD